MTPKEYLRQGFLLGLRIEEKIEQLMQLNKLALSVGIVNDGMPKGKSSQGGFSKTIDKIVDLQAEINQEIDKLVDLKREIKTVIDKVENEEYRLILSLRYLNYKSWEQIAEEMAYTPRNIHYMHGRALKFVRVP